MRGLSPVAGTPPILKVPTLIGWDFFARSPSENRNDVASVASAAARLSARFPQIPLSVINRDASARDATSSIFNDLQAAGSISNLVLQIAYGIRLEGSFLDARQPGATGNDREAKQQKRDAGLGSSHFRYYTVTSFTQEETL